MDATEPFTVDSSSSSSSSTSDEDEDKQEETKLEAQAKELEAQISANKYLYDAHLELVNIYHKTGDLNSLREAYTRFYEVYPLTPTIWLAWIRTEIGLAESDSEKQRVLGLFEKAVLDYQSVDLWLEYVQFAIGCRSPDESRQIFERGLSAVGLHVAKGHLLWDSYREFEICLLSLAEPDTDAFQQQLARIADVFKRQLSVPLMNMDSTYAEYQEFKSKFPETGTDSSDKSVEYGYRKASKLLDNFRGFESQLLLETDEQTRLAIYQQYLKAAKDPSLAVSLYERILLEQALNGLVWNEYCMFVLNLGLGVSVSQRALRNTPWHEDLWVTRLRILEHEACSSEEVLQAFEEGVQALQPHSGSELWLGYLEYVHRNKREDFRRLYEKAEEVLRQYSQQEGCKVLRFAARVFAEEKQMELVRKIGGVLAHKLGKTAAGFLEQAELEKRHGDAKNLRILYQKAVASCADYPQQIAEEWLLYERQHGTLKDVLNCLEKCSKVVFKAPQQDGRNRPQEPQERERERRKRPHDNAKPVKVESKRFKPEPEPEPTRPDFDPSLTVFLSNLPYAAGVAELKTMFPHAESVYKPPDRKGKPCCYAYCTFATPEEVSTALARDRERLLDRPVFISECKPERTQRSNPFKYSTGLEASKLFVRGLPFVSDQQAVENIFKPFGATSVRLVTKKNGQSKGCAYVDFANEEAASTAMKETDGLAVGEHRISVAVSQPPPKREEGGEMVREAGRNARTRLGVALVPRGVQLQRQRAQSEAANGGGAGKSNEDFRKMFLS